MKLVEVAKKDVWESGRRGRDSWDVSDERLSSLKGAPTKVRGDFNCSNNNLKTLQYAPTYVGRFFDCSRNELISLVHAPTNVGHTFDCSFNKITNLHNIHKYITHIDGVFASFENPIQSHILGLLLIDGLAEIDITDHMDTDPLFQAEQIIQSYLDRTDMDKHARLLQCQDELIDAGLEPFARL